LSKKDLEEEITVNETYHSDEKSETDEEKNGERDYRLYSKFDQ
jgi:hypothetical protein